MSRAVYVEADEPGPIFCPNCGGGLGSASDSHMTIRHDCGAEVEWCVSHEHLD